jgi:hypothetical protein
MHQARVCTPDDPLKRRDSENCAGARFPSELGAIRVDAGVEISRACVGPCPVCGSVVVRADEVFHRVQIRLAECPRCDHRWTTPAPDRPDPHRVRRVRAAVDVPRSWTQELTGAA